jgi:hypothetical protein
MEHRGDPHFADVIKNDVLDHFNKISAKLNGGWRMERLDITRGGVGIIVYVPY